MTVTELPRHPIEPAAAPAVRWMPSRAGILNVWRYYDEVFEFHQGRLLLRGPNGTGKSKALELLLPFLFDANLRANRLSTFGTGERTMHWNLMGEGASGTTRVGYVWLEFRLPGDPGAWFCCGARLQASNHTSTAHADYFTTSLRIGTPDGLSLVTEAGTPLTRSALEQALGEHGVLHPNAAEYRSAVRTTLFPGLSEQRYDVLISALLQLRTPKLSQRLDPSNLSTLLSGALPPLGQQEIADLAEGFERLDRQRERLARLDDEVAAARGLAARQRTYAQRVLRAASAALISATTDLDNLTKSARRSADEHERVATEKAATESLVEEHARQEEETKARIDGLVESEAYQQGRELDQLRQRTEEALRRAGIMRTDADGKRAQAVDDAETAVIAGKHVAAREHTVAARADESRQAATRANLTSVHSEVATVLDTDPERSRPLLRAAVKGRLGQVTAVRQALDAHEKAVDRRGQAEEDLDDARGELADAEEGRALATEAYEQELDRLTGVLREWAAACRELRFADLDVFADLVENEAALAEHVDAAAEVVRADLIRAETVVAAERMTAQEERDGLAAELDSLAGERDLPPKAPVTRTTDRTTMAGAPLWRLIRFADGTPDTTQAAVEAALESAGLLDAWVGATGAVAGHDVFADPDAVPAAPGRSLSDVVVPEADTPVPAAVVTRFLAAIAFGDHGHPVAIGADGSWRLGNLRGSWQKSHAEYIGAVARERARERRARELRGLIAEADAVLGALTARQDAIDARRAVLAGERTSRPSYAPVKGARERLTRAESVVDTANRTVRKRLDTLAQRESAATAALHALTVVAAEHGLPTDRSALSAHEQAVDSFREQAELWLDGHRDLVAARAAAQDATLRATRSDVAAGQREDEAREAESLHHRLAAKLDAVEQTIGRDYREVLADLAAQRGRLIQLGNDLKAGQKKVTALAEQLGVLAERSKTDADARDDATEVRDAAARRFRHLATTSFPADSAFAELDRFTATLAASEGVRAALDTARLVAATWPAVPHEPNNLGDALHRLSEAVHECRTTLSARADLGLETDEDVQVFTAVVDGVRVGAAELLTILRADAEQSRHDITERERQLFDQTLTGDTRRHLAARIRQAGELVDAMNVRLERVRTASKVAVRLVWQVAAELPAGTRTARDLLLKDPARLTDADRESLHQFFRERIEEAKADDTAASWEQQLAQVFDYTRWHQFVVKVDRANGSGWQLLTKKLHGALSGGEKAIALHLPLFAAVAAHYHAVPTAPRIILLDEVFVGVDSSNRGQVFALLSALDLDLLLTSDHEWCTYPELTGVAIHQLITGNDGDDAVTTARFVWDGTDVIADDDLT